MKKHTTATPIRARRKPLMTALEPRILLDGAALVAMAEMATDVAYQNDAVHSQAAEQSVHFAAPAPTAAEPSNRREVAFVDTSVSDYQSLVAGLGEAVEVVLIDGSANGLEQMVAALQGQSGVDAIHLFSHGAVGELKLGTLTLNADSLPANAELLSTLGESLTESGDLMLYGCYVGADSAGQSFIDSIASMTLADVAASEALTGAERLSVHAVDSSDPAISFTSGETRATFDTSVSGNTGGITAVSAAAVSLATSITAVNDAPVLDAPVGGTLVDTAEKDTFDALTGTLTASDYIFTANSNAINGLNTTEAQAFTVTVSDGHLSHTQILEFTLQGVNDNPIFAAESGSTQVSVFSYPNLNGNDNTPGSANENANLASIVQWVINEGGQYSLDTSIQNFTDADFADKLNASGFFFMTDMEQFTSSFNPRSDTYLPSGAAKTISNWVNAGGVIMMTGTAGTQDVEFLNRVFGWDLTSQNGSGWSLNVDNAAGTPFEGGPSSLNAPSATDSIGAGTVDGFKAIYGTADNATVAEIGFGAGRVLFLGYDYYDSGISGTGFTDTATQYGADVANGSSNTNDWVTEIIPRALEYSANLSSNTTLTETDSTLSTSGKFAVSDVDQSDSVSVTVSAVTAEQRNADGTEMTSSSLQPTAGALLAMLDLGSQPVIDNTTTSADVNWVFNSNTETFDYLAAGQSLVLTYQLTANDDSGGSATRTLTITINGVNEAPVAQSMTQEVAENGLYAGNLPAASDVDGTIDAYELVSGVSGGTLVFNADGSFSFDPGTAFDYLADGESANVSFTYRAKDNLGAASAVASMTLTVIGSNDVPVVSAGAKTTGENDRIDTRVPSATDVDGTIASYQLVTDVASGSLTFNSDGTYRFEPGSDFDDLAVGESRQVNFTYSATDNDGGVSAPGTITFTLQGVNDNPIFAAESGSTQVSVFSYPNLNGNDNTPGSDNENANLASIVQWVINEGGQYSLDTSIQNFTDADFADKLNASGFFFMTDMEQFTFDPRSDTYLPSGAAKTISNWVNAGGVIMMTGTYGTQDVEFLNRVFRWDLTSQYGSSWSLNVDNAAGTPFEGGPSSLNAPSATDSIGAGTVDGFKAIYGTADNATVAEIGFGAGRVLFLGYDYYDSGISGTGFTDTATQYGADVANGSSNTNAWVTEIIPRALEYSANLSSNTTLTETDSTLSTSGKFAVSDVDQSDSVSVTVSAVTAEQRNADGTEMTSSSLQPTAGALLAMLDLGSQPVIDNTTTSADVNWVFNSNTETFDYLAAGQSLVLTYQLTANDDSGGSATRTLTITVNGVNDAPVAQSMTQEVAENGLYAGNLPAASDVDGTIASYQLVTDVASGSLTFNSDGTYRFDPGSDFDDLAVGESRQVNFTYSATDNDGGVSAPGTITITITGTNDAPTITAEAAEGITEVSGDSSAQDLSDSGVVSFDDLDSTDVVDITFASNNDIAWSGGTLDGALATALVAGFSIPATVNADAPGSVNWAYSVADVNLDFLAAGETLSFSYTITATDSQNATASDTVTFTISGSNDAPTITAEAAEGITEVSGDSSAQDLSDSGVVSFDDLDSTDVVDITFASNNDIAWSGGTLDGALATALVAGFSIPATVNADAPGSVNWAYSVADVNLDFLAAGETLSFSYTITATDSQNATASDTVTFTISGSNDAPTITAEAAEGITEVSGDSSAQDLSDSGVVSFDDLDSTDVVDITFASNNDIAWSGGTLDGALATALVAGFSIPATVNADAPGSVNWAYSVADVNLDFLAAGETLSFSYTITATDSQNATASDTVTFTISGSNDAPTITAEAAEGITEVSGDSSAQDLSDSGVVSFDDLDSTDVVDITFASNNDIAWSGGTLDGALATALVAGFSIPATVNADAPGSVNWAYSVADVNLDFLAAGETLSFSYTITATDSQNATASDTVTFTISGSNDAPTITAEAAEGITEVSGDSSAQDLSDSGVVSFDDLDSTDVVDITFASNNDIAWSGGTLDGALATALVAGFSIPATVNADAPGSVNWAYSVADVNLDFLAAGETLSFSYTITATDSQNATASDTVTFTISGSNDAPTITAEAAEGITEVSGDSSAQDLSDSGVVSFDDLDSTDVVDITFASNNDIAWSGGTLDGALATALVAGFSIPATVNADAPGSVNWAYSVADVNLDFLAAGETLSFSYTITATDSQNATASDTVTFTISGSNDAPTITAEAAEGITEVSGDSSAQDLSDSGVVSFDDLDSTDVVDITFASNNDIAWSGGTLDGALATALVAGFSIPATVNADAPGSVNWAYSVADVNLDFLAAGETLSFSYTITATDSQNATASDTVTFTISGSNDAPTITAEAAEGITEVSGDSSAQDLSDSGVVSFDDLDSTDVVDITFASNNDIAWSGGTLDGALATALVAGFSIPATVNADAPGSVNWAYSVADVNLDFLAAGETLSFSYTITATDSQNATASDTVTFTISGSNDAPTITAEAAEGITEVSGDSSAQDLSDSGVVSFDDLDSTDVVDITFASNNDIAWSGGTLDGALATALVAGFSIPATVNADAPGSVNWAYSVADVNLDFLAAGETLSFSYTITATDSQNATASDTVTFTISGSNDAPTITAEAAEGITEVSGDSSAQDLSDSGVVSFDDLDSTDVVDITFASNNDIAWSGGTLDGALATALVAGFSIPATVNADAPGSVNWAYSVADVNLDFLAAGETLSFSYTITATDSQNATASDTVTFTISGSNDAPTITAEAAEGITEVSGDSSAQDLSDSGVVSFDDLDSTDVVDITFASNNDIAWSGGTLDGALATALVAGFSIPATVNADAPGSVNWAYSVADVNLDFLAAGETLSFSYTITATDSQNATATDTVTFTITGTNDAPTITADAAEAITEVSGDSSAQDLSDSGVVSFDDLDSTDVVDITFASNNDIAWSGGTLDGALATALVAGFSIPATVNADAPGSVNWAYDVSRVNLDFLAAGETLSFSYTITATDSQNATASDTVTFTISGSNDAPVLTIAEPEVFTEAGDAAQQSLSQSGYVEFEDVDVNGRIAITFTANNDMAWQRNDSTLVGNLPSELINTLTAGFSTGAENQAHSGQVLWTYNAGELDLDFLNAGDTITFSYTVTVKDSQGATADAVVTVTVLGTNDAPELTGYVLTTAETIMQQGADYQLEAAKLFHDKDSTLSREDLDFKVTGLPAGIRYNSETGAISGKATESGKFLVTVTATDTEGASISRTYEMIVTAVVRGETAAVPGGTTPTPRPTVEPQPVKTTLSDMPSGLLSNTGSVSDSSDSRGYMAASAASAGEAGALASTVDSARAEPLAAGAQTPGSAEQVILSEPGALVIQTQNPDGKTSVRASVDVSVMGDGRVVFTDVQREAFSSVALTVASIERTADQVLTVTIQDTRQTGRSQLYTGRLSSGESLPSWIKLDPSTGSLTLSERPAGQKEVSVRIQTVGSDGQVRVLELNLDLDKLFGRGALTDPAAAEAEQPEAIGFVPLSDQLEAELSAHDNYGDRLMALLQSA